MDGCEPQCGCGDLNSEPLEEQSVFLTAEPSFQPQRQSYDSHFWKLRASLSCELNVQFLCCQVRSLGREATMGVQFPVSCTFRGRTLKVRRG